MNENHDTPERNGFFRRMFGRNSAEDLSYGEHNLSGVGFAGSDWLVAYEPEEIPDDWVVVSTAEYPATQDVDEIQAEYRALLDKNRIAYMVSFLQKKAGYRYPKTYYAMQIFVPPGRAKEVHKLLEYEIEQANINIFEQDGGLVQITCPECGDIHDMDFPKCPECGHRYIEE